MAQSSITDCHRVHGSAIPLHRWYSQLGGEHLRTKESAECLKQLTEKAVMVQKKVQRYQHRLMKWLPSQCEEDPEEAWPLLWAESIECEARVTHFMADPHKAQKINILLICVLWLKFGDSMRAFMLASLCYLLQQIKRTCCFISVYPWMDRSQAM